MHSPKDWTSGTSKDAVLAVADRAAMRFPLPKVRWCLAHGAVRISAGDLHAWVQKGSSVGAPGVGSLTGSRHCFPVLGIWLGLKLTRTRETVVVREVPVPV